MHVSYLLHSLDCNLADGEYVLIPEQGAVHEEDQEQAPETAIEDICYFTTLIVCRFVMCT
jgi:hypothetical protein